MSDTIELAKQCGCDVIGEPDRRVTVSLNGHIVFVEGNLRAFRDACVKEAKESSRKELEAAKQRICVLEEVAKTAQDCQRIVERINHEILAEKAALGKKLDEMTGKRNVCARTFDKMKAHAKTLEDSLREVTKHNEELTKLLAAEREAGRELGLLDSVLPDEDGSA